MSNPEEIYKWQDKLICNKDQEEIGAAHPLCAVILINVLS